MEEQEFDEILTYLSKSKYPDSVRTKDSRSNWRKKCRPFTYCKDELFYNHKKYGALLVVKGIKEKRRIIESSHLQPDGRHHGINRTLKKVSTNYYWKTIAKDVHNYVKIECQLCVEQVGQQHSILRQSVVARCDSNREIRVKSKDKIVDKAIEQIGLDVIGNILEPSVPSPQEQVCSVFKCEAAVPQTTLQAPLVLREHIMAQCGLDVVGPLSETHRGKRFIVVLTDCVTKWAEVAALAEFTTEGIGGFLAETICRHGAVEEVLTKHSQEEFCARLTERVCSLTGLTLRTSSLLPTQPGGYGDHYWYNSLLCGALVKYSSQNQYHWDVYLQQVALAYRTFHQKGTPGSPFQLLYDRPTRLPVFGAPQLDPEAHTDEQEALVVHMTSHIKALTCPPHHHHHHHPLHSQNGDRLTPPYIIPNTVSEPVPATPPTSTTQPHPHATHVVGAFTPAQGSNPSIPGLPLTSLGSSPQNSTTIYTIPGSGVTTQTLCAASVNTHTINTQGVQVSSLAPQVSIQGSSASSQPLPSTTHLVTASPSLTNPIIVSATPPTPAQTPTAALTSAQASNDAHSGHMVMIHTDGKTYADSFYVICPQ